MPLCRNCCYGKIFSAAGCKLLQLRNISFHLYRYGRLNSMEQKRALYLYLFCQEFLRFHLNVFVSILCAYGKGAYLNSPSFPSFLHLSEFLAIETFASNYSNYTKKM